MIAWNLYTISYVNRGVTEYFKVNIPNQNNIELLKKEKMKKSITLLMFIFGAVYFVSAQQVRSIDKSMSLGKHPALYAEIEGADEDMAKDYWEEYVKDFGKTKRNKKAKEYFTEDARIPVIASSNTVTLYAKFEEGKGQTTAYLWVDNQGGFEEDNKGMRTFLEDYALAVRRKVINKEIEKQEDVLKGLTKDMEKLVKKNNGYHKDIAEAEDKIRKSEENIEKNLNDQDEMNAEMQRQKEVLDQIIEKLNNVGKDIKE